MYQYKSLTLKGNNKIKDDIINQLNSFLEKNKSFRVHSLVWQNTDNKETYWQTYLLEENLECF